MTAAQLEHQDPLHLLALEVEKDERLNAEMAEWDQLSGDGLNHLGDAEPPV